MRQREAMDSSPLDSGSVETDQRTAGVGPRADAADVTIPAIN
jgi:hypothetical protein